jgi:hypothetical protein
VAGRGVRPAGFQTYHQTPGHVQHFACCRSGIADFGRHGGAADFIKGSRDARGMITAGAPPLPST